MASVDAVNFAIKKSIASNTVALDSVGQNNRDFMAFLKVANHVAGTYDVQIQHSADRESWEVLADFANLSADGFEYIPISGPVLLNVRAVINVTGGDAEVTCQLWSDPNR